MRANFPTVEPPASLSATNRFNLHLNLERRRAKIVLRRTLVLSILISLSLGSATLAADKYELDPVHTRIGFTARHLMINNVSGRFTEFTGTILYDEQDITKSAVSVKIQTASVNTENKMRDDDLR